MSGSIGSVGGNYSTLAEILIAGSTNSRNQLTTLEEQSASGYVAQTYGGLGAASSSIFSLSPQINQIKSYQSNINSATANMGVTQTALTQIASIAQTFYTDLSNVNNTSGDQITSIAANAKQALSQVASLLDTTNGGEYVFSGQDSANPAVPNPNAITSSGMFTQISTAVGNLSSLGSAGVISAALTAAQSDSSGTTIFSTYLSQTGQTSPSSVQVGDNQWVQSGVLANSNTLVTSTGSNTTGSYMRDIIMSLSVLGSLSSSQATDPGLSGLVTGLHGTLSSAISAISSEQGVLGDSQTNLQTLSTNYTNLSTTLSTQLGNVEDVNMALVSTQLQSVQTQLTASYQLISNIKSLSLTAYL